MNAQLPAKPTKPRSKTAYTPVFNTPSTPESLKGYLGNLSRDHLILAHAMSEIPESICRSLSEDNEVETPESRARVDALRKRVEQAYQYAKGDTADGKWSLLVQLLRMPSIKGRARWIGTTTEAKLAVSNQGWINAQSETEWFEWEHMWKDEESLKQKVQIWQQKVDTLPIELDIHSQVDELNGHRVSKTSESQEKMAVGTGALSDVAGIFETEPARPNTNVAAKPATLGFPVIKRSSLATVGKPKPSHDVMNSSGSGPINPNPSPVLRNGSSQQISKLREVAGASSSPVEGPPLQSIADISEQVRSDFFFDFEANAYLNKQSFLPPSFQDPKLQTSTPINPNRRRKPSPIPDAPASSPLSSPPNVRIYGRQRTTPSVSSSPFSQPPTPTRNPTTKRPRSPSTPEIPEPGHTLKKARTLPLFSVSRNRLAQDVQRRPDPDPDPTFVTPKRPGQLPTLTELLAASAKTNRIASPNGKQRKIDETSLPPPERAQTTDAPRQDREEGSPTRQRQHDQLSAKARMDVGNTSFRAAHSDWDAINAKLNTNLYEAASPAKSLSSLAASDSESDDDENGINIDMDIGDGFDPPLASTQAQGNGRGTRSVKDGSFGWTGYNSQFDVDGKVDAVSKFLEKDVSVGGDFDYDIEYDGWIREPSP